jgi:peptidoglycan hydrolase-like protein with peptidoglycan-binding domain
MDNQGETTMSIEILRNGSKGKAVRAWQHFLIGRGHLRDEVDGDFGPRTEKATRAFQRAEGWASTGSWGPVPWGRH